MKISFPLCSFVSTALRFIINVSCISRNQQDIHYFAVIDAHEKCTLAAARRSCSAFNTVPVSLCIQSDQRNCTLNIRLFWIYSFLQYERRGLLKAQCCGERRCEFSFQILKTSENFAKLLSREELGEVLRRLITASGI